jgi:hypothetical protein
MAVESSWLGYITAGRWQERPGGRVPYSIALPVARSAAG